MILKAQAQVAALLFLPVFMGCVVPKRSAKVTNPDAALRAIFQQQIQGAFDPLTDDQQVQTLKTRLALEPNDVAARLELAGIYERYRFIDDARTQYTAALRSETIASQAEQAILGLARCALGSDGIKDVIPVVEGFLQDWPSASAWNQLGLLHGEIGNLAEGEKAFRQALALDNKSDSVHNNLGHNLMLQNKLEAAEAELRKSLELNSKSATTRNNLGVVLARRGDLKKALEQFMSVADAATAHNNLAVVLLETGQYEQSREELVKALMIRQYFAPALANFKLVQEKIRERTELQKQLPLSAEAEIEIKDPEER